MKAYLQFGPPNGPLQTVETDMVKKPLWWQKEGLFYSATGYGSRIPTRYMVKWNNRWRRVYCAIFSNAGTCYIGKPGAWLATVDN